MPAYAQDILFVATVALAFVLLLRGVGQRLDRRKPHAMDADRAPKAERRDD